MSEKLNITNLEDVTNLQDALVSATMVYGKTDNLACIQDPSLNILLLYSSSLIAKTYIYELQPLRTVLAISLIWFTDDQFLANLWLRPSKHHCMRITRVL